MKRNTVVKNPLMKKGGKHIEPKQRIIDKKVLQDEMDEYSEKFLAEIDDFIETIDD